MNKLHTTIAQGRRRQLDNNRTYTWRRGDISIRIDVGKGDLTIILPKIPNDLDKMKDVTPKLKEIDENTKKSKPL